MMNTVDDLGATRARILVATDLSDPAGEALRQAQARARLEDAALGVCHVLPGPTVHMLFPQAYVREALEELTLDDRVRDVVGGSVASITGRPPSSFQVFIDHGTDYAEIVRRADTWRATVVVVGSHGQGSAARAVLGSVATRVVRYAHCAVLVARPPPRLGLVLAATDLSEASLPAVAAAAEEARLRGAKLAVLHVVDHGVPLASAGPSMGLTPLVPSPEMLRDLREAARVQIEALLAKRGTHAELIVVEGRPTPTILDHVARLRPELVVVGTRGRTGLARVVLGSVAEHVVRAAGTSVLAVRLAH